MFRENLMFLFNEIKFKAPFTRNGMSTEIQRHDRFIFEYLKKGSPAPVIDEKGNEYLMIAQFIIDKIYNSFYKEDRELLKKVTGTWDKPDLTAEELLEILYNGQLTIEAPVLSVEENEHKNKSAELDKREEFIANRELNLDKRAMELEKKNKLYKSVMIAVIIGALLLCLAAFLAGRFLSSPPEPTANVQLVITEVTPIGETDDFGQAIVAGYIIVANGSPDDLMITMAVRGHDNNLYGPKPSLAIPRTRVTAGSEPHIGHFTCVFAIAGSEDIFSSELQIFVISRDFIPGRNVEATRQESVVYEIITR